MKQTIRRILKVITIETWTVTVDLGNVEPRQPEPEGEERAAQDDPSASSPVKDESNEEFSDEN